MTIHTYNFIIAYIFPIVLINPVQNVMVSNVTDIDDIAVFITWEPPNDPNSFIHYYHVQYVQTSDPLADTGSTGSADGNVSLDTDTVLNEFANISEADPCPIISITLIIRGLG